MPRDGTDTFPDDLTTEDTTPQNPTEDGSIRSLSRKSSDFSWNANRLCKEIQSYPKNRRYGHLQLNEMYRSLVTLYSDMFRSQWSHFKRVGDMLYGNTVDRAEVTMAQTYISHWILDLYSCVRASVARLTPVAFAEHFTVEIPISSKEYDLFLNHLLNSIRPTHVVGCHEDALFIPLFITEQVSMLNGNPFGIDGFAYNPNNFRTILAAIKDKRASWKTSTSITDFVGRPFWLFDWHQNDQVCSWFPKQGNYTNEDVMYAFLIGVACTPKLAHEDADDWQLIPAPADPQRIDTSGIERKTPRRYFANYEVNLFRYRPEKFILTYEEGQSQVTGSKRPRIDRLRGDPTQPGLQTSVIDAQVEEVTQHMLCFYTALYYNRVVKSINSDDRLTTLRALLIDHEANAVC